MRRYQDAHDRRDTGGALAAFTPDVVVVDEDRTYRGSDEVRGWLDRAASEYTYTRTFVGAERTSADVWVVVNHLEGTSPAGRSI